VDADKSATKDPILEQTLIKKNSRIDKVEKKKKKKKT
jgi:hypothetical protein